MVCPVEEEFVDDADFDESRMENQSSEDNVQENSSRNSGIGPAEHSEVAGEGRRCPERDGGLAERLRNVLRGDSVGDLYLQENDRENGVLQWLQALDLHVTGACRADERLKPLLKLNVSSGTAEDLLLAHLSQYFEAVEVGMLARCLCVPLVSIRVGKVIKQGSILSPTAIRGHLNLTLLPSSDLRISFVGDDDYIERLAVLSSNCESPAIVIEEISADSSGRSFLMKLPGEEVSYFWCAEKSKLLGAELLTKMKDLLMTKPTLAQLTGISESRLDCFATHLRAYLFGPTNATCSNATTLFTTVSGPPEFDTNSFSSASSSKSSRFRSMANQQSKSHCSLYQSSLSPRSNTFKDGLPRHSYSSRNGFREKLRRRNDNYCSLSSIDSTPPALTCTSSTAETSYSVQTKDRLLDGWRNTDVLPLTLPGTFSSCILPALSTLPFGLSFPQATSSSSSLFSPYYCWCPPCTSTLQYTVTTPHLPPPSAESLSLPPLSSLLSIAARSSSSIVPLPSPDHAENPLLDFPALLPDPMVRFPLPVSSFITIQSSQQIPTIAPFISDPIVHIPVVDVCSSGQRYLVSAGPSISTTLSPLLPNLVNHSLISETDTLMEKGARDTLRLLIGSTQMSAPLVEMLPAVFTGMDNNIPYIQGKKLSCPLFNSGSRGLYSGTRDVEALANSISVMGIVSMPGRPASDEDSKCNRSSIYNALYDDNMEDRDGDKSFNGGDHGQFGD